MLCKITLVQHDKINWTARHCCRSRKMKSIRFLSRSFRHVISRHYHKSKYDVTIENCSVSDFLLGRFEKHSNKTALIDGLSGRKWTFGQLIQETNQLTKRLKLRGYRQGDVACLCGTNAPEFAHVFTSVTSAGMVLTIANAQSTAGELCHQILETNSKLLFVTEDLVSVANLVRKRLPTLQIIVFGSHTGCFTFDELQKEKDEDQILSDKQYDIETSCEDVALLPFSSGTTGVPKGVMLTHRNLVAQITALSHETMLPFQDDDEKCLSVLPMVHIAGLVIGMLNPLSQGATVITLPRFRPDDFLTTVQKYKVSFSLIAPPVVGFLADDPRVDQYDISCFKTPYSGAAPLGKELTEKMVERLKLTGIRQGYGMSEASPALTTTPKDSWKYGSIGVPLPNTECKIVDVETGATLGANETGEIWSRGPQVMKGYLNNPVATAEIITEDNWLKTGDIGYYDDDGHYYVVDRLKEIIKYKGYQVAPAYLESILVTHPDVVDAAVVGVPHELYGHLPRAFVVCKKTGVEDSVAKYVNDQVAPYKRLRGGVFIVDEIPRSASGKILRRCLL